MLLLVVLAASASLVALSNAQPLSIDTQNVVTVPPNCPPGQEFINGECRDVWIDASNVVVVPPNCPAGQQLINGQCRDVWRQNIQVPTNLETLPLNCPLGQEYINGRCRESWSQGSLNLNKFGPEPYSINSDLLAVIENALEESLPRKEKRQDNDAEEDTQPKQLESVVVEALNIISVPSQCPSGFRPDGLGICRPIFD